MAVHFWRDWASEALTAPRACPHRRIVSVELNTGERVAHLCLDCDAALPADFASPGDR